MKYTLIWELLQRVEQFEREQSDPDGQTLSAFTSWLVGQGNPVVPTSGMPWREPPASVISRLLFFIQRYALVYTRHLLENTSLTTFDDFTYLATLWQRPGLTKIELIECNIHGKTTGMEVIRRLIAAGLVRQQNGEADKRSKQLFITQEGESLLHGLRQKMARVGQVVVGDLSETEQQQLLHMLTRLHQYHNPVYLGGPPAVERVLNDGKNAPSGA